MSLLILLLSLLLERLLGSLAELRRFGWLDWLRRRVLAQGWGDGTLGVVAVVVLPLLGLFVLAALLHALGSFFSFVLALLVLLYSLGPGDLEAEIDAFAEARARGDEEAALLHAAALLGADEIKDSATLTRSMLGAMLAAAHERFFGVVFWFVLLGPLGALLYRVVGRLQLEKNEEGAGFALAARRLHQILSWVPARLAALTYALSGSFVDGMQHWHEQPDGWWQDSRSVLIASGLGALRYQPPGEDDLPLDMALENSHVHDAMALIRRAALIWLAVIAVGVLAGLL